MSFGLMCNGLDGLDERRLGAPLVACTDAEYLLNTMLCHFSYPSPFVLH
jgi:hypothetical protein